MTLSSIMLALAFVANVAFAQSPTGTASIIQIIPAVDGAEGQILGTGSDGETTYRLFGTLQQLSLPFTATLVQDSSHMSESAIIEGAAAGGGGGTASLLIQAECSFTNSGAQVSCVQALVQPTATSSLALTGVQSFTALPILSGTAIPSFTSPASGSGSASASGSGGGSESLLPPELTSSPSSSGPGPTASGESNASSRYTSVFSAGFAWSSLVFPIAISYLASFVIS